MSFNVSTPNAILDSELSMQNHISKVAQTCYYHIRHLKQVRKLLGPDIAAQLVASLVFSRLDYSSAILADLARSTIATLRRVQNAAALLVARLGPRDHMKATLKDRHTATHQTANSVMCADASSSYRTAVSVVKILSPLHDTCDVA